MAVKPVLRMGDPRLLLVSAPVREFGTAQLRELITDMEDTMRAAGGAGLAAPQIGVLQRVVIFGGGRTERYPDADAVPYTVLINPKLKPLRIVPRYRRLRYRGSDESGQPIDRTVSGFHARVVQHEVDHLDGVLYPMRIQDLGKFGFLAELFPGQDVPDE